MPPVRIINLKALCASLHDELVTCSLPVTEWPGEHPATVAWPLLCCQYIIACIVFAKCVCLQSPVILLCGWLLRLLCGITTTVVVTQGEVQQRRQSGRTCVYCSV
jgi:hypothetical protein